MIQISIGDKTIVLYPGTLKEREVVEEIIRARFEEVKIYTKPSNKIPLPPRMEIEIVDDNRHCKVVANGEFLIRDVVYTAEVVK